MIAILQAYHVPVRVLGRDAPANWKTGSRVSGVAAIGVINTALSAFGCLTVAAIAFGLGRGLLHRAGPAGGDPGLAAELGRLAGRRARRVSAMVVDLEAAPATRSAFIDAGQDTRFEIGSVTKGLAGMLLAEAISRGEAGLDTTVAALLPETKSSPVGSVTLRELATHTSGLSRLPRSPATAVRMMVGGYFGSPVLWTPDKLTCGVSWGDLRNGNHETEVHAGVQDCGCASRDRYGPVNRGGGG